MHKNVIDITGERFGHLIAKYPYSIRDKLGRVHWVCKCDCGSTILVRGDNLRRGNTKQCSNCNPKSRPSKFVTEDDNL